MDHTDWNYPIFDECKGFGESVVSVPLFLLISKDPSDPMCGI
jgi:hypothetical protein